MKKIIVSLAFILLGLACMPLFSACSNFAPAEMKSVYFTKDVFEADYGESVELTFKVNPSNASNYSFSFNVTGCGMDDYYLDEETYLFTIRTLSFKEAKVALMYGLGENDVDTCIVRAKEYPTNISFSQSQAYINQGGTYNLVLNAVIGGEIKVIDRSQYNIELTSSSPNIVSVNENNLVAISTGLQGQATITAKIKKLSGTYLEHTAEINLIVVPAVDQAYISMSDESEFIKTSSTYQQTAENTYKTSSYKKTFSVLLYSDNICLDYKNIPITVSTNNSNFTVDKTLANEFTVSAVSGYTQKTTVCIVVSSEAVAPNGNPLQFIFYVEFFSTPQS